MKRSTMIAAASGLIVLLLAAPLFAQSVGGGKKAPVPAAFSVTIIANVPGAMVLVDNSPIKGNSIIVPAGVHNIRVSAPGYLDYNQNIKVSSNMTVNAKLVPMGYPLTINTNVRGAIIIVDGVQIAGNMVNVAGGNHSVRVVAAGYEDFNTTVGVNGPTVVNAPLQMQVFILTINPNVKGALIFVDGAQISGSAVGVAGGTHSIRVVANGYQDYTTTVNVDGPMQISAALALAAFPLTVNANIPGAMVAINNVVKGPAPYTEALPSGTYTVVVSAPGYASYGVSVAVNSPMTVNAQLQPSMASLNFVVPPGFLDPGNKDGLGLMKVFVDGKLVNPKREVSGIQVEPGRHRISVSSGGLFVQTGDFDFAAGMSYSIELFMELRVKSTQG